MKYYLYAASIVFIALFSSEIESKTILKCKGISGEKIEIEVHQALDAIENRKKEAKYFLPYSRYLSYFDNNIEGCKSDKRKRKFKRKIRKLGKEALERRLKRKFSYLKNASKYRDVSTEYADLLKDQESYLAYGSKRVIPNTQENYLNMEIQSRDYANKRKKSCTNINLKDSLTSKVYDQHDVGWCYAFSASDLISQHLGEDISRSHLATMYNKFDIRNYKLNNKPKFKKWRLQIGEPSLALTEGGSVNNALEIAKEKGVCKESDLPSYFSEISSGNGAGDINFQRDHLIKELKKDIKAQRKVLRAVKKSWNRKSSNYKDNPEVEDLYNRLLQSRLDKANESRGFFSGITTIESMYDDYHLVASNKSLLVFLNNLKNFPMPKKLKNEIEQDIDNISLDSTVALHQIEKKLFVCSEGRLKGRGILNDLFPNINISDFTLALEEKNKKDFFLKLQDLSCKDEGRKKFDFSIKGELTYGKNNAKDILDEALDKGRLASISFDAQVLDNIFNLEGSWKKPHAATIIARRWNHDKELCEYQIKNSWGKDWQDNGFKWLGEDEIDLAVGKVDYIE